MVMCVNVLEQKRKPINTILEVFEYRQHSMSFSALHALSQATQRFRRIFFFFGRCTIFTAAILRAICFQTYFVVDR